MNLTTSTGFNITNVQWYTTMDGYTIGIVSGTNGFEEKSYIGVGIGSDEDADAVHIAETGAKYYPKEEV